jgi:L-ascorbate metabolism protein UlaG (beta-lactamase superfamily)
MKFTKFGHSCLLIEEGDARILFDPGSYSIGFEGLENLDAILITHTHGDHLDIPRIKDLLQKNPGVRILTNPMVTEALEKAGVVSEVLKAGETANIKGVEIEAVGDTHAEIYKTLPRLDNVGFMVQNRFFYPGDAFTLPEGQVEILGAPVSAPWMRISEGIDYIFKVNPKIAIPMHDGIYKRKELAHGLVTQILEGTDIKFTALEEGKTEEL